MAFIEPEDTQPDPSITFEGEIERDPNTTFSGEDDVVEKDPSITFKGEEDGSDPLDPTDIDGERSFIERSARFLGDFHLSVAQGATFGFSDEAAAYAGEALGYGDYETVLKTIRDRHDEISLGTQISGEIVGGIATTVAGAAIAAPLAVTAAGIKAASWMAKLPGWLKASGLGTLWGGTYGFGTGEGGFGERAESAGIGAFFGLATGPAYLAGVAVKKGLGVFGSEVNKRWNPTLEAYRRVQEAIKLDGLTASKLRLKLKELGPQATILDAGGPNMAALAREAAKAPGPAMNRAIQVLGSRAWGEGERLLKAISRNVDLEDFFAAEEMFLKRFETLAKPVYQKAYQKYQTIMTPGLKLLLRDPDTQQALAKTAAIFRRERNSGNFKYLGAIDDELTELANYAASLGKMQRPETPGVIKGFSLEVWDQIKRGFDDVLDSSKYRNELTGKLNNEGRSINMLRKKLLKELDGATGGDKGLYSKARKTYGDIAESLDALRDGKLALKESPEVIKREMAELSDAAKEAYRSGAVRAMKDIIFGPTSGKMTTSTAEKLFSQSSQKARLRALFPNTKDRVLLEKVLNAEIKFNEIMKEVMPKRAMLQIEQGDFTKRAFGAAAIFAGGSSGGLLLANLRRQFGEQLVGPQNAKFKESIIKALINRNPADNLHAIDLLFKKTGLESLPPAVKYGILNELLPLFMGQQGARLAEKRDIYTEDVTEAPVFHKGGLITKDADLKQLAEKYDAVPDLQRDKQLRQLHHYNNKTFNQLLDYLENH